MIISAPRISSPNITTGTHIGLTLPGTYPEVYGVCVGAWWPTGFVPLAVTRPPCTLRFVGFDIADRLVAGNLNAEVWTGRDRPRVTNSGHVTGLAPLGSWPWRPVSL